MSAFDPKAEIRASAQSTGQALWDTVPKGNSPENGASRKFGAEVNQPSGRGPDDYTVGV
jgi:hypothetical protein